MTNVTTTIHRHRVQKQLKGLPAIKNIIAIASGKGGVGKSTVTACLALALQKLGVKVGIVDADIYGPSIPKLLGSLGVKASTEGYRFQPIVHFNIPTLSIGHLIDDAQPAIWRGPMVSKAIEQLIYQAEWPELDYLLVDLPPGTGDIHLTLCQKIPLVGVVILTTPQSLSTLDAEKALNMCKKVEIPVLGVIENMSTFKCGHCGTEAALFGTEGGASLAKKHGVPLLGQIPLHLDIQQAADTSELHQSPIVLEIFSKIALEVKDHIARLPRDLSIASVVVS